MFYLLEQDKVTVQIFNPTEQPAGMTNMQFTKNYTVDLLKKAFPNLQE